MEVEKARDEAEQHGYDVRVAKTEDALRAEVLTMCQTYCARTWGEALNWAGVEISSELRKPENIFYPPAIRVSDPPSIQGEVASAVAVSSEEAQPQDPPPPSQQEQAKEPGTPKEVSSNAGRPSDKATEVPHSGVASQGFELALALVTMLVEEAPKEKEEVAPPKAAIQADKTLKNKFQIKLKPWNFFSF